MIKGRILRGILDRKNSLADEKRGNQIKSNLMAKIWCKWWGNQCRSTWRDNQWFKKNIKFDWRTVLWGWIPFVLRRVHIFNEWLQTKILDWNWWATITALKNPNLRIKLNVVVSKKGVESFQLTTFSHRKEDVFTFITTSMSYLSRGTKNLSHLCLVLDNSPKNRWKKLFNAAKDSSFSWFSKLQAHPRKIWPRISSSSLKLSLGTLRTSLQSIKQRTRLSKCANASSEQCEQWGSLALSGSRNCIFQGSREVLNLRC